MAQIHELFPGKYGAGERQEFSLEDRQYMAGAIDSNSWLNINRTKTSYFLRLLVSRKERKRLDPLTTLFSTNPYQARNGLWILEANSDEALRVLLNVYDFLRLVRPIAELGIQFQREKALALRPKYSKRSVEEKRRDEEFAARMHEAKRQLKSYDIGDKELSFPYVAALFEQKMRDPYQDLYQLRSGNPSLIQKLHDQFGGMTYPKGSREPRIWRLPASERVAFEGEIGPHMRFLESE